MTRFRIYFSLLALLLAIPSAGFATEVPVVGIATGDATRGPLVDYLQAIRTLRIRTPGFELISPEETAKLIDKIAAPSPPQREFSDQLDRHLRAAKDAVANEEWERARVELDRALSIIEVDGKIPLGQQEVWYETRLLIAEAWVLDQPNVKKKKRTGDTVSDAHYAQAKKAIEPILMINESFRVTGDEDPIVRDVFLRVLDEIRRTGTLTVDAPASGAPVYINGVEVGVTPLKDWRLSAGAWEIQAGRPGEPSRIHLVEVPAGGNIEITLDPNFEFGLTSQGYAIVEAPPGQSAAVSAVQVGSGTAKLTESRYALVFAVEGAQPLLLYAALVDGQNNVVLRERTVEVQPGPVDSSLLNELLLFVVEGKEVDKGWPAARYGWVIGSVFSVGLAVATVVFIVKAADLHDQYLVEPDDAVANRLEDDSATFELLSYITGGVTALAIGLTIYFAIVDATTDNSSDDFTEGDWFLYATPIDGGGAAGITVVF